MRACSATPGAHGAGAHASLRKGAWRQAANDRNWANANNGTNLNASARHPRGNDLQATAFKDGLQLLLTVTRISRGAAGEREADQSEIQLALRHLPCWRPELDRPAGPWLGSAPPGAGMP